jgi:hypothetical protein
MVDKVADLAISNGLMCCQQAATAATAAASVAASNSTTSNGVERETFSAMSIVVAVRELLDPLRQLLLGMSLMREKTPQVGIHTVTYRRYIHVLMQYSHVHHRRLLCCMLETSRLRTISSTALWQLLLSEPLLLLEQLLNPDCYRYCCSKHMHTIGSRHSAELW